MDTRNFHHEDLVLGTVYLVHEGENGFSGTHDIVLVPIPSTDPTDPLVCLHRR
jgi:hypothetical protein